MFIKMSDRFFYSEFNKKLKITFFFLYIFNEKYEQILQEVLLLKDGQKKNKNSKRKKYLL